MASVNIPTFEGLPGEILNKIYDLAFGEPQKYQIQYRGSEGTKVWEMRNNESLRTRKARRKNYVALLRVNKQIHKDASSLFYSRNIFTMTFLQRSIVSNLGLHSRLEDLVLESWFFSPSHQKYLVHIRYFLLYHNLSLATPELNRPLLNQPLQIKTQLWSFASYTCTFLHRLHSRIPNAFLTILPMGLSNLYNESLRGQAGRWFVSDEAVLRYFRILLGEETVMCLGIHEKVAEGISEIMGQIGDNERGGEVVQIISRGLGNLEYLPRKPNLGARANGRIKSLAEWRREREESEENANLS